MKNNLAKSFHERCSWEIIVFKWISCLSLCRVNGDFAGIKIKTNKMSKWSEKEERNLYKANQFHTWTKTQCDEKARKTALNCTGSIRHCSSLSTGTLFKLLTRRLRWEKMLNPATWLIAVAEESYWLPELAWATKYRHSKFDSTEQIIKIASCVNNNYYY